MLMYIKQVNKTISQEPIFPNTSISLAALNLPKAPPNANSLFGSNNANIVEPQSTERNEPLKISL